MALALTQNRLKTYAGFVKLEHTVFSLPLIFAGAMLGGFLTWRLAGLILLAASAGRVMAMGFNRLIDAEIDARNPRTAQRELPRGAMRHGEAWAVVGAAGLVYAASAAAISPVCLWMAPVPVALFVGYPYLKRVTAFAHLGLGLAWSMAPVGGWLATTAAWLHPAAFRTEGWSDWLWEFRGEAWWLWLFSVFWVSGFDVIYATMDEAFDREAGLHSLPAWLGSRKALGVAALLHGAAFYMLYELWRTQLGGTGASLAWLAAIGALFLWQHAIAARNPELAFFKLNSAIGFLVLGFVWAGGA